MPSITSTKKVTIAEVVALPDEIRIDILAEDGVLTRNQAYELAQLIIQAADESHNLDWADDKDGMPMVVPRTSRL
jgi:hypothetical protein